MTLTFDLIIIVTLCSVYFCPGNSHTNFVLFSTLLLFFRRVRSPYGTDGQSNTQTDKQTGKARDAAYLNLNCTMPVWRFGSVGNVVDRISEVNRRRARLVLGWVTDRLQTGKPTKPSRYVTSHPGQLSLAIPPWVGAMSTSESWHVNRHTARCTSPVSVVWQCKLVSG